jgi:ATP-binding cassette subfamily A (ABC1) protein 1
VWFNNKAWTTSVAYLNAVNNVVLRASLPSSKMEDQHLYGIQVISHPMNFTKEQQNDELV